MTAFGLAAGVGLVMGVIGVSQGLSDAQTSVLSPLGSVGTDIIVTRTVAPTTSQATTTTTLPSFRGGGSFPTGGTFPAGGAGTFTAGGGGFFARGVGGFNSTDSSQAATLLNNNSSIITDLAKLGKPGTQFTHDFFVPGTLITFPSVAISDVAKIPGVTSAVGALSLSALHESGTVPKITDTVKTGGQTISTTVKPPTLTAAQTAVERTCIQKILSKAFSSAGGGAPSFPTGGRTGTGTGSGSGFRNFIGGFTANPAIEACITPAQKAYEQDVTVPEETITRILNPPSTSTATSSYKVGGWTRRTRRRASSPRPSSSRAPGSRAIVRTRCSSTPSTPRPRTSRSAGRSRSTRRATRSSASCRRRSPATSRTSTSPSPRCRASPRRRTT